MWLIRRAVLLPPASFTAFGLQGGISPEEATALRKELEQTEVLIRGYQQENEAATRRIKARGRGPYAQ